jgi:putative ABC transport system ATP-binding protein
VLQVNAISKGYWRGGAYLGVLKDVSLQLAPGEIVAVTGRRLGGKSTLLQIIAGIEVPDAGNVTLAGLPVRAQGRRSLRDWRAARRSHLSEPMLGREMILVTREGPHQELEVSKYVGSPMAVRGWRRRAVQIAAAGALDRVGARDCMGRCWGELSNYQRALVGLARAFAGAPRLVILDDLLDAHSARDTEMLSDLLHGLVEESNPECGVLLSTGYYESAIVLADRVCALTPKGTLIHSSGRRAADAAEDEDATNVVQLRRSAERDR